MATPYRCNMTAGDERPTGLPCEDCGGLVVAGLEPIDPAHEDPDVVAWGISSVGSEWCTNLDCPSNHAIRGLHRVGVSSYVCKVCGEELSGPVSTVFAHRRSHSTAR
jgi:hypothetical protein